MNLFPGQYRIDVEKQGFKHYTRTPITVEVQLTAHIDAVMQVGEVSQEVRSETPLLQAETSSLGTVVYQREANELPLNPVKLSWGGGDALTSAGLGIGSLRPDYIPGCDKNRSGSSVSRITGWFNTACFTAPSGNNGSVAVPNNAWTFGNEPRVDATLRQQGVVDFDFAVFKRTSIYERMNIEFRTEFFNLFNHPQFGPPNGTVTSSTFGQVTNTVNNPRLVQFGLKFVF